MPLSVPFSVVFIIIIHSAVYITYFDIRALARYCPRIPVNIVKLEANIIFINMRSQGRYQIRVTGELIILSMDILLGKHRVTHTCVHRFLFMALTIPSKWQVMLTGKQAFSSLFEWKISQKFQFCLSYPNPSSLPSWHLYFLDLNNPFSQPLAFIPFWNIRMGSVFH